MKLQGILFHPVFHKRTLFLKILILDLEMLIFLQLTPVMKFDSSYYIDLVLDNDICIFIWIRLEIEIN